MSEEAAVYESEEPTPPVEETEEATTSQEEVPADDPGAEPEEKKQSRGVQKRIDELVRAREDERRAREIAEARLHEVYTRGHQPQPEKPAEQPPKEDDFDDYNTFLRASARYEARQEFQAEQTRIAEVQRQQQQQSHQQAQQQKVVDTIQRAKAAHEDFDLVVTPSLPVSETMLHALAESDYGHDILYHLGKNPQEAARINTLTPFGQVRELGKIELRLAEKPTTTTKAPEPIKPVSTAGNLAEKDPAKMTDAEYSKWRRERLKSRR